MRTGFFLVIKGSYDNSFAAYRASSAGVNPISIQVLPFGQQSRLIETGRLHLNSGTTEWRIHTSCGIMSQEKSYKSLVITARQGREDAL